MTAPGSGDEGARPPLDGDGRDDLDGFDDGDEAGDVSLGELLREARRQRAITLADVERDTRINAAYIEALESYNEQIKKGALLYGLNYMSCRTGRPWREVLFDALVKRQGAKR